MSNADKLNIPIVESSEVIFHDFLKVTKENLFYSSGHRHKYYTLDLPHTNAVIVIAKTPEGKFVLNQEYRHPTKQVLLSGVGGFLEDGEQPEFAAQRELLEETGYTAENFKCIGLVYPMPGICTQKLYVVTANNAVRVQEQNLEPSELIKNTILKPEEVDKMIASGVPVDGILCSVLYLCKVTGFY
jgi:ADP-ribose pyrophosphatase